MGLIVAASGLFAVLFAVTCHRLVLLPKADKDQAFQFSAYWRLIRFLLWVIGLSILEGLVSFPFSAAMAWFIDTYLLDEMAKGSGTVDERFGSLSYLFTLSTLPAIYLIARVSVVFPSIAVDRPLSIGSAWSLTKGNGWKMAVIVFLFPWLLFKLIEFLPTTGLGEWAWLATIPFVALVFVVQISALSMSYGQLASAEAEPNQQPKPTP